MLNYEYARLVEQDRRREIELRLKLHRALHPDEAASDSHPKRQSPAGRGIAPVTGVTTVAR